MGRIKRLFKERPMAAVFYTFMILAILYAGLIMIVRHGDLSTLLFLNKFDTFMDFFNCIRHVTYMDPYGPEIAGSYPAFAYAIFALLSRFFPREMLEACYSLQPELDKNSIVNEMLRVSEYGMAVFVVFTVFVMSVISYLFYKNFKGTEVEKILFLTVIFLSAPYLFWFERGNIISIALIGMAVFVFYRDSKNPYIRELALISLAISACVKIYPALLGILLLKDKRWKEAIRCVIYGILLFVLPFLLFKGGLQDILHMIQYIFKASGEFDVAGYGYKVNISNSLLVMSELLHIKTPVLISIIGKVPYVIAIISAVGVLFLKEKWKEIALLSCILVAVPNFSNIYTLVFMTVPLIMFLNETNHKRWIDWIYMFCFLGMFVPIVRGASGFFASRLVTFFPVYLGAVIESWSLIIMMALLLVESFTNIVRRIRHAD